VLSIFNGFDDLMKNKNDDMCVIGTFIYGDDVYFFNFNKVSGKTLGRCSFFKFTKNFTITTLKLGNLKNYIFFHFICQLFPTPIKRKAFWYFFLIYVNFAFHWIYSLRFSWIEYIWIHMFGDFF
jgi:hypothetical protein